MRDVIDLFQSALFQRLSGPNVGKPTKRSLQLFFMVCYDTELMLFGENTIKIHEETAAMRMEIAEQKLQQHEAEAREKRAADGDGMYDDK